MPAVIESPSPNFDGRGGAPIDILLLHYTGMATAGAALARLRDPAAKVSAHYLIEEDGRIHRLVAEEERAWHAGKAWWAGATDINARSVGIELVNPGHELGYVPFPPAQMAALRDLCRDLLHRHPIPPSRVLGHSDVAPTRKRDPGELFDWPWLAAAGIGLWPSPLPCDWDEARFLAGLAAYGYDVSDAGAATLAFARHFRPRRLVERMDAELAALLNGLTSAAASAI